MNSEWNLEPIYKGFEDPAFEADMGKLSAIVKELPDFVAKLPQMEVLEGLRGGVELMEKMEKTVGKLALYASLRQATNTRDTQAGSAMGRIMGLYSGAAAPNAELEAWIAGVPNLQELAQEDEVLKEYGFMLKEIVDRSRYLLPSKAEAVMARMSLSGGDAWSELHQHLTSTVKVSYRDTVTNLSAIRSLAYDPDPQVRKDAYEAELACYKAIEDPVAYALNSLKLETISQCSLRGYESPLERTLKFSNMKRETLDAMLGAIEEYLPKFRQYLKAKAKALGHEGGLPWYDLFAPMGETSTKYTTQECRDYLVRVFSEFDREEADMIARAFDEAWIDFFPREGKSGGAFCAGVEELGESRILTNYDGLLTDIVTLAHELGHAFHNHCVRTHRPLNRDYSMPLAETASTFNECVFMATAIAEAKDEKERIALIESQLQDVTQIIVDILSRYLFESDVLANREQRFMNAQELCGMMEKAQERSYGDGLDPNFRHPYMWVCKGHYYGMTFYNFPYAFGGLFARGLYARYRQEGAAFVPKYKGLLHTTPIATAEDVAKVAGIDLTDRNFWRGALEMVAEQIDQFCALETKE